MSQERVLPSNVSVYARSPTFTSQNVPEKFLASHDLESGSLSTVPDKLLGDHDLKKGTWGLLHVESGAVSYFLSSTSELVETVTNESEFVIFPEEKHYIEVSDDAVFFIKFLREPRES